MSRRGLILATLTKLKQVCAHPSLVDDSWAAKRAESGKLERLEEMIDEIVENGGKSLVFTQFFDMGKKLRSTLADRLGKPVLFYHGGLTRTDRDALIERFQTGCCHIFSDHMRSYGFSWNGEFIVAATSSDLTIWQRLS